MPICPKKVQKGAKVGGAVGQNQLSCILLNIGTLDFFDILQVVRPLRGISFFFFFLAAVMQLCKPTFLSVSLFLRFSVSYAEMSPKMLFL